MRLYLPGPSTPDLLATKWLLQQRGYQCVCAADVLSPDYRFNHGMPPTHTEFRQRQVVEMLEADAVVLMPDELGSEGMLHVLHACRFSGCAAVLYDELPAQCPSVLREDEVLDAIALRNEEAPELSARLRAHVRHALRHAERWARAFDARWGWFFTNGNKQRHPPPLRPYPTPTSTLNTTA